MARFHLNNGAMAHDVHTGADLSANGVRQSCGLMANYLYDLRKIGHFHEGFAENHTVAASGKSRRWPMPRPQTAMAGK
jgi:malonyl-CoA decarboxylase